MNLAELLTILKRHIVAIAILTLVGGGIGMAALLLSRPQYEATSQVFVSTASASSISDVTSGNTFTQQVVKSYAAAASTPLILSPVIKRLKLPYRADQLAGHLVITAPLETVIISITASDESPLRAAAIANSIALELKGVVPTLTPSTGSTPVVKVTVLQSAVAPTNPVSPRASIYIALGLLLGAAAGVLYAVGRTALDNKVRTSVDAENASGSPGMSVVAYEPAIRSAPLASAEGGTGTVEESFRTLRTNLQFTELRSKYSVVVTSSIPGEGKSVTASNLAISLAHAGRSVLLIDGDLRRPTIADNFSLDGTVGLTNVLIGEVSIEQAIQEWSKISLSILPAGAHAPNPSELLQSGAMNDVIAHAMEHYDCVVVDAPPVLVVSDATLLASKVTGVLLVSAYGKVSRGQLRATAEAIRPTSSRILGVVLTMAPKKRGAHYNYTYNYSSTSVSRA